MTETEQPDLEPVPTINGWPGVVSVEVKRALAEKQITHLNLQFVAPSVLAESAVFSWQAIIGGRQYGGSIDLGQVQTLSYDEWLKLAETSVKEAIKGG